MKTMIRIVCVLMTLPRLSLSLPIAETEPSYKSGPDGRGTIELLWSCFLTFGLCVWTVVHPNVIPWTRNRDQTKYRMGAVIGAIFAPEILVLFALGQFLQAKEVLESWESLFHDNEDVKGWLGKPGAFFVVMGGFVVDVRPSEQHITDSKEPVANPKISYSHDHDRDERRKRKLVHELRDEGLVKTIRPNGFCKLLKEDWFRDLIKNETLPKAYFSHESIKDKGKADSIANFLLLFR